MKYSLISIIFASLLAGSLAAQERSPNVIILLVDDMAYGDVAALGNPIIKTPNFDKLHEQSVRFTNFSVSPSCSPTRCALMTGKHEFLSGVTHTVRSMHEMNPKATTIAQLFQRKGYKTGHFGKWHLGQENPYGPWRRGFEETLTVPDDAQKTSHFNPTLLKNRVATKYTGYREDILFGAAIEFIERNKDKPFFCYLATYSPHSPHKVPGKYSKPYEAYRERYGGDRFSPAFFGMIANVDENLGRLMTRLKELKLEDNTIIIAMNDNGGTNGVDVFNGGRRGVKGTIWSGGTHAYSFWKWGNHFPPGNRPQMAGQVDVLPTLADLCGLEVSADLRQQLEGDSLRPVLEKADATLNENRMQVHHVGRWSNPKSWPAQKYANCSVSWKNYTLVRMDDREAGKSYTAHPEIHHKLTAAAGKWELYDLDADPMESTNIAAAHPDIVAKMTAHYEAWWKKVEVELTARWGKGSNAPTTNKRKEDE